MAVWTYEPTTPIVPNTTMQKGYADGVFKQYIITPNEGYVMHNTDYDFPVYDEYGYETGEVQLGYHGADVRVGYAYAFTPAQMQDENGDTVTAYGAKQFFTKLESDVGEGADIFGTTDQPEVM